MILSHFELPGTFVRHYRPLRIHPEQRGVLAYLFDPFGLDFFRSAATARPVPSEAVWSVVLSGEAPILTTGESGEAIGFVVTDQPFRPDYRPSFPLPKRLTSRERVRLAVLRELQQELSAATAPAELIGKLICRLDARGSLVKG